MKSVIWGLAGKYCAGKNRVGKYLEDAGCLLLDADKMGHRALEEEKAAVTAYFGNGILDEQGFINRIKLGDLVFGKAENLKVLEEIIHPIVIGWIEEEIIRSRGQVVVINAALIFETPLYRLCDRVIWVKAPLVKRIIRGKSRDNLTFFQIVRRIWAQRKLSPQPWRKDVDIYSIPNSGSEEALMAGIGKILERE